MTCDAHVHVGYFPRKGREEPFYYSPRRVLGILDRAGVMEFIFSSTNAVWDFNGDAMHREAREILRLAGKRAHAFFWVTDEYLKHDPDLSGLPDFYEGFKLHGGETPWLRISTRRLPASSTESTEARPFLSSSDTTVGL